MVPDLYCNSARLDQSLLSSFPFLDAVVLCVRFNKWYVVKEGKIKRDDIGIDCINRKCGIIIGCQFRWCCTDDPTRSVNRWINFSSEYAADVKRIIQHSVSIVLLNMHLVMHGCAYEDRQEMKQLVILKMRLILNRWFIAEYQEI